MPDMKHPGKAGDAFTVVAARHRSSLNKEERHAIALHRMAQQAIYEVQKAEEVFAHAQKALDMKKAQAMKAQADFEAAAGRLGEAK